MLHNTHPAISFTVKLHTNYSNNSSWNVWSTATGTCTCTHNHQYLFWFLFFFLSLKVRLTPCQIQLRIQTLSYMKHVLKLLKDGSNRSQFWISAEFASKIKHTHRPIHRHIQYIDNFNDISGFENNFASNFHLILNTIHGFWRAELHFCNIATYSKLWLIFNKIVGHRSI